MRNLRIRLCLGFTVTLLLSILPMPELVSAFRPPWVLLLVLYIEYFLPVNFRLTTLLFVGLLLDVLLATVIGEHSFALLLVTWIASSKSRRFQFFSMMQQIFLIGFFCLLYQLIISLITALLGFNYSLFTPVASALVGMFVWPWIRLLGEDTLLKRLVYR
ncbi:rod shape-determining protein MreD [Fluoribacter dumoffii]|uniref:Rod shape-determining protein mreD n=1 Tax=Fluoribacter dumoffii TaxID=463 RepID=A0A377GAM4_9GAMM|nr:rod shape-determining protein MreD [Fluoribacter dumoffii]KTC88637.1 Rod shape-determining protein MreD [Fluoribacter dumoffii NY 23]MCW8386071.1 rod shape-determining protein MreD [Fluoribacter dumoffii]MCW8419123.1 rod shape-determining protein MreD [Fluoribacter dumoffii]MCW8453033.1 rod shape-determining protein MreD [Fluoribacter dumoffii]MCW8459749.1 rod shape-determining protein MreD [Fluoribacter dumoffii]